MDRTCDMPKITLDTCLKRRANHHTVHAFIQAFLCHHMAGWDVHIASALVLCSEHADGRLHDSPAASKMLSSSLNKNQVQFGSGTLHSTTCQCSSSSTQDDSAFVCTADRPLFSELCMAADTNMEYWADMEFLLHINPMAKTNRPFLSLQWSSSTTCCPYFLIRNGLLEWMSALSEFE